MNLLSYSAAGVIASASVGGCLALGGTLIYADRGLVLGLFISLLVAAALLAREMGWIRFPLPQVRRQTSSLWAKTFPAPIAAAFWGFDLGLVFTTWVSFGGAWVLAVVTLVTAEVGYGAALFIAYWSGRALSVWLSPLILRDASIVSQLIPALLAEYSTFRRIHAFGLASTLLALGVWVAQLSLGAA